MGRTFYEALAEVAKSLTDMRTGTATGGNTTTLIDTGLSEPNDYFNFGSLFIEQTVPVIRQITDWNSTTCTFTFAALSGAVVAGTPYAAIDEKYPLDVLKNAVNTALRVDAGKIMVYDETLTAVDDQERYDLPAGVSDIRRVEIGTEDDTWENNHYWVEEAGVLRFYGGLPSEDDTIRLHYVSNHAALADLDDEVNAQIPWELVINSAIVHALMWRQNRADGNEKELREKVEYYKNEAYAFKNTARLLPKDPRYPRY